MHTVFVNRVTLTDADWFNDVDGFFYILLGEPQTIADVREVLGIEDTANWHHGSGPPPAGLGVDGDYYLDITTGDLYFKTGGDYTVVASVEGPPGPPGPQGPAGAAGAPGPQGPAGADGAPGTQGPPGATGAQGAQGPAGPKGDTGTTGATGPAGADGAPGATGATGPAGADGAPGPTGATGAQGPKGDTGDTGAQGIQGPPGPQGIQGPVGPEGPQGPPGTGGSGGGSTSVERFSGNGSTVNFTLATAPTDENSTLVYIHGVYQQKDTYSVSGTTLTFSTAPPAGTSNIEVVNGIGGVVGPTGPAGPTGATGATGPAGPTGATGAQGPAGNQIAIADSAPAAVKGEEWFESDAGGLYMRYQNPDLTFTWILVNAATPGDYLLSGQKGAANGVASLDAGVKVPLAQIPATALPTSPNYELFPASGTFSKSNLPASVTHIVVQLWAGGGGGGGFNNISAWRGVGGGGGGFAQKRIAVSALAANETVTVGAGGVGGVQGNPGQNGTAGGTSSFGAHCSATGGLGGAGGTAAAAGGVAGGGSTGGDIGFPGGASETMPSNGGAFVSAGGMAWMSCSRNPNADGAGNSPGCGGSCGSGPGPAGGGAKGFVIVYW